MEKREILSALLKGNVEPLKTYKHNREKCPYIFVTLLKQVNVFEDLTYEVVNLSEADYSYLLERSSQKPNFEELCNEHQKRFENLLANPVFTNHPRDADDVLVGLYSLLE